MPAPPGSTCQNPDHGWADAEVHCSECQKDFCLGHARHPDHSMPEDRQ
jgi:hypothetical protein